MPLQHKYAASDVQIVLQKRLTPITNSDGSEKPYHRHGGATAHYGYESPHALVLFPVADTERNVQLRSITKGLTDISSHIQEATQADKKIILPVAEVRKIFGLFPRNHWVTLSYDPISNKATLIDSRPWFLSFLYPTKTMENMLREGLSNVLGSEKIAAMKFNKIYQGVQHNDTHCGAWTTANIMSLAGVGIDGAKKPNDANAQAIAFTRDDEVRVINDNIKIADNNTPELSTPKGWWQKLLIKLGLTKYTSKPVETIELVTFAASNDYTIITETLCAKNPKQQKANPDTTSIYADDWTIVTPTPMPSSITYIPDNNEDNNNDVAP